jgi:hypothetical protein
MRGVRGRAIIAQGRWATTRRNGNTNEMLARKYKKDKVTEVQKSMPRCRTIATSALCMVNARENNSDKKKWERALGHPPAMDPLALRPRTRPRRRGPLSPSGGVYIG